MSTLATSDSSRLDTINPSLTRYRRSDPAPVLPLRDEPDLLSWLESSGRLVADEETASTEVSTVEEEELSALMGEKEDYNKDDEPQDEDWEDRVPQGTLGRSPSLSLGCLDPSCPARRFVTTGLSGV